MQLSHIWWWIGLPLLLAARLPSAVLVKDRWHEHCRSGDCGEGPLQHAVPAQNIAAALITKASVSSSEHPEGGEAADGHAHDTPAGEEQSVEDVKVKVVKEASKEKSHPSEAGVQGSPDSKPRQEEGKADEAAENEHEGASEEKKPHHGDGEEEEVAQPPPARVPHKEEEGAKKGPHEQAEEVVEEEPHHPGEPQHSGHAKAVEEDSPGQHEERSSGQGPHEASAKERDAAKSIAIGLVGSAILIPVVVHMALAPRTGQVTLRMLDIFVAIFISVVWFNLLASVLDYMQSKHVFYGARVTVAVGAFLLMYFFSMLMAYLWRDGSIGFVVICSFAPHCIAFAGINASFRVEEKTEDLTGADTSSAAFVAGCLIFCSVVLISILVRVCMPAKRLHEAIASEMDHMEMDAFGMVATFMATRAICAFIVGHHIEFTKTSFLLLDSHPGAGGAHAAHQHSGHGAHATEIWQMLALLSWAVGMLLLAAIVLPRVEHWMSGRGYWASLAKHTAKVLMVMMVAWAFLLGAEWCFFYIMQDAGEMFSQMLFAIVATILCLAVLEAILLMNVETAAALETRDICITGASLVAAWSWEECFNEALNTIGDVYQVGYGGLVPKAIIAVLLPAIMVPVHMGHIKPHIEHETETPRSPVP